ncbi:hypothetical protein HNQ51_003139 [Inhella inkyongensis]|uniref:Uncharacterized protein n=1 Tax=Inhella inkyongensis TaxID=392593 RepID=A0A840S868_9BURK|nr:hypothetical protein [Inhella inkyongensis]MBB5205812.1 hypothetical protein [Inhella inkyongensis]
MSKITFNTRPVLTSVSEALTLITMAGLTLASAAVLAATPAPASVDPVIHQLPTVEIVGQKAVIHQLPLVIVTAKRST